MKCPKCGNPFATAKVGAVEVDRCTGCTGLWFDRGELEQALGLPGSAETLDFEDPRVGQAFNEYDEYDCPACGGAMLRMVDPKQHHIWFEKCSACHGVFLDAGEFKDLQTHDWLDYFKDLLTKQRP
jgi:Zn-finger nucleic acid-binding protein